MFQYIKDDYFNTKNQIAILKSLEGFIPMVKGVYLWNGSLGKDRLEGRSLFTSCVAVLFELFTTSVDHFFFILNLLNIQKQTENAYCVSTLNYIKISFICVV